jgi:hypothetical protein
MRRLFFITSDGILKIYYTAHDKYYTNAQGKFPDFAFVREEVKNDYFSSEESLLLLKTFVSINEKLLQQLSKKKESDLYAIEVVFYKPGGTFPRVAFPTIDEAWSKMR